MPHISQFSKRWIVSFMAAFAAVALCTGSFLFAIPRVPDDDGSLRRTARNEVPIHAQVYPQGIKGLRGTAAGARGVMLQAKARFQLDGEDVNAKDLELVWEIVDKVPQLGLKYRDKVTVISFGEEETLRVASWVGRVKSTIAFTLLEEGNPLRCDALKQGLKPIFGIYMAARVSEAGRYLYRSYDFLTGGVLVAPLLQAPSLVTLLAFIDFSEGYVIARESGHLLVEPNNEKELLDQLNEGTVENPGQPTDISFTNSDVGSDIVVNLNTGAVSGAPYRFYWMLDKNGGIFFTGVRQFKSVEDLDKECRSMFGSEQKSVMSLFRVAAILRAFQFDNTDELVDFINDGVDRRTEH